MNEMDSILEDIEVVDFDVDFDAGVYEVKCKVDNKDVTFTAMFDGVFNLLRFICNPNEPELIEQYKNKVLDFVKRIIIKQCWFALKRHENSTIFQCGNSNSNNKFDFEALVVDFEDPDTKHFCAILDKLLLNYYTKGNMNLIRQIKRHVIKGNVDFLVKTEDIVDSSKIHEGIARDKTNSGASMIIWDIEDIKLKRI